jgi:MFS family permease
MSNYWFAVSWLPRYLQVERGLSAARSGSATLLFVVGSLTGYLAFGWLSDRWGRRASFSLFCGVMTAGLLGFTALWPVVGGTPGLVYLFLFVAGLGTGTWSSYGPMFSEIFPTRVRGTALAVIMNLSRGVQFVAPVVIAAVAPVWGMGGGIALAAGFAALAGLWIWTLPETRGRLITA